MLHAARSIASVVRWATERGIDGTDEPVDELAMLLGPMIAKAQDWAESDDRLTSRRMELCDELEAG